MIWLGFDNLIFCFSGGCCVRLPAEEPSSQRTRPPHAGHEEKAAG